MRRAIAISLIVFFLSVSALPLWANAAQASVPACCRRDGTHHCGMMAGGDEREQSFRSKTELCPYRSGALSVARSARMYAAPGAKPRDADVVVSKVVIPATPVVKAFVTFARYERGPPSPSC